MPAPRLTESAPKMHAGERHAGRQGCVIMMTAPEGAWLEQGAPAFLSVILPHVCKAEMKK